MMLPEQVVPFLLHEEPTVRDLALRYLIKAHDPGPMTADYLLEMMDRFPVADDDELRPKGQAYLTHFPQTPYSCRRLLDEFVKGAAADDNTFQRMIGDIGFPFLKDHCGEILNARGLTDHVRYHLRQRLELAEQPVEPLWDRLMELGQEVAPLCGTEFDARRVDRLIEALSRSPEMFIDRAMQTLDDPSAMEDWRSDSDAALEDTTEALSRIGTVEVIEKLAAAYPKAEWDFRLFAKNPVVNIKRPESEPALLSMIEQEEDGELRGFLLGGLTEIGSLAGLDASRKEIKRNPDHPDNIYLAEELLAVSIMTGTEIPEAAAWRKAIAKRDAEFRTRQKRFGPMNTFFNEYEDNWRETGISTPRKPGRDAGDGVNKFVEGDEYLPPLLSPDEPGEYYRAAPAAPIRRETPKVGRNDPCPCGSGKKYKKYCAG